LLHPWLYWLLLLLLLLLCYLWLLSEGLDDELEQVINVFKRGHVPTAEDETDSQTE
jgi:hypothetical protein